MKILRKDASGWVILLPLIMLFSCSQVKPIDCDEIRRNDSVAYKGKVIVERVEVPVYIDKSDSLGKVLKRQTRILDSLNEQLFLSNYKIQKVKYYLKIIDRNPSQGKFLRGWVRRAVE